MYIVTKILDNSNRVIMISVMTYYVMSIYDDNNTVV